MKIFWSKVFFIYFFAILFLGNTVLAYTPLTTTGKQVNDFIRQIENKLSSFPTEKADIFRVLIQKKLLQLQNSLIWKTDVTSLQKNALYESVRRQLLPDSFDTEETIFDDGVWAIWTHAPKGVGILYNPVWKSTIWALSSGTRNTLINGSYFSRKEETSYHSWLLWSRGVLWSEVIYDDSQITHIVCLDTHNRITFWPNGSYFDGLMDACETAFQAGPMIYSLTDGVTEEHLATKSYIWRAHNRTVIVLFEKNGIQDLWFLTLIKPTTLSQVRDVVLRESRFRGEYDAMTIFNLDGWSSVAYRNPDHAELNFWSSKVLPVVFEIYK